MFPFLSLSSIYPKKKSKEWEQWLDWWKQSKWLLWVINVPVNLERTGHFPEPQVWSLFPDIEGCRGSHAPLPPGWAPGSCGGGREWAASRPPGETDLSVSTRLESSTRLLSTESALRHRRWEVKEGVAGHRPGSGLWVHPLSSEDPEKRDSEGRACTAGGQPGIARKPLAWGQGHTVPSPAKGLSLGHFPQAVIMALIPCLAQKSSLFQTR